MFELASFSYTAFYGEMVRPGALSQAKYNHYSLLRTVEEGLESGNLGQRDATAAVINNI